MSMPGFTAETSVYRTDAHYRMTAGVDASGNVIRPQACDLDCLGECLEGCTGSGRQHAECVRNVPLRMWLHNTTTAASPVHLHEDEMLPGQLLNTAYCLLSGAQLNG